MIKNHYYFLAYNMKGAPTREQHAMGALPSHPLAYVNRLSVQTPMEAQLRLKPVCLKYQYSFMNTLIEK